MTGAAGRPLPVWFLETALPLAVGEAGILPAEAGGKTADIVSRFTRAPVLC